MLTGATPAKNGRARTQLATRTPLADVKGIGNPQHFIAAGQGALPRDSNGRPWKGDPFLRRRTSLPGPLATARGKALAIAWPGHAVSGERRCRSFCGGGHPWGTAALGGLAERAVQLRHAYRRLRPPRGKRYISATRATMTAAAIATTATVEAARITRHSFPGDPLVKTTSAAAGTKRRGDVTQRP
jgi:hypothetical protein